MMSSRAGSNSRPTWQLVLEAAELLSLSGSFQLARLVAEVQKVDPTRLRSTIQPVVQGMTLNAGKGPPSPCGRVLVRVSHGWYRLARPDEGSISAPRSAVASPSRVRQPSTGPRPTRAQVATRLAELIVGFDEYVDVYDRDVPFRRTGQYEDHRQTIDRRHELGSVGAAVNDDVFTASLYATLRRWGLGIRASRLVPLAEFRTRLRTFEGELERLEPLQIESETLDIQSVTARLDWLISVIGVVENASRIVAGTKTLHHLLPDLVPPMDRAWSGLFFGWNTVDPGQRQTAIFTEAFEGLARVAQAATPSRLVGAGWRTSSTKILDNALIGYCKANGIGRS